MKLLLTSAGVTTPAIRAALEGMLGKPLSEATALCIPTAQYGHPWLGPGTKAWEFISGTSENPMVDLGWKTMGVLELTALPSIPDERWKPLVHETDVLLAAGGDALYLAHWIRESGLLALLPELSDTVWVGMSAGSMVMTPRIGREFVGWAAPSGDDTALGLVDFAICPHLARDGGPGNPRAAAEKWASTLDVEAYAIDDRTAISVVDGVVEVISEGGWRHFPR